MGACIFQIGDRWPGASASVRQCLTRVNFKSAVYLRLQEMLVRLKLEHSTPTYESNCWAHFSLKQFPVAILLMGILSEKRATKFRENWSRHGKKLMVIVEGGLDPLTDEQLDAQFKLALKEIGKAK